MLCRDETVDHRYWRELAGQPFYTAAGHKLSTSDVRVMPM